MSIRMGRYTPLILVLGLRRAVLSWAWAHKEA